MQTTYKIIVDDVELLATNLKIEEEISEPTGNQLKKLEFDITVKGYSEKEKLEELFNKKILSIKIPDKNIDIRAKTENRIYSYQGDTQDQNTIYKYTVILLEQDKYLPEDWNPIGELATQIIMNWIRTRAISELLIEKNIITKEEYEDKLNKLYDRDYNNLRNYILYGIEEKKSE